MKCPTCNEEPMVEQFVTNQVRIKPFFALYTHTCLVCGDEVIIKKLLTGEVLNIKKGYTTKSDRKDNLKKK